MAYLRFLALGAMLAALTACSDGAPDASSTVSLLTVHKTPTCGCCGEWVEHMEQAGFEVAVVETSDLSPIRQEVGLPYGLGSCHTAQVDGYFIEGHVPAADVQRFLSERPEARGLTVPGMPLGSPGMEVPSGAKDAYDVLMVLPDGSTVVYASHGS
jgi:hypothetical protein